MELITNRLEFPRAATPEPDFDLDITNCTPFDNFDDGFMAVRERAGEEGPIREESHFPFADKPASLLPKPAAPKGTQGKDYSLPDLLCHWDPSSYTTVQNALRKISMAKFVTVRTYDDQTEGAKDEYLREAIQSFPFIDDYPDGWPAVEFAKMYLKNSSHFSSKKAKGSQ